MKRLLPLLLLPLLLTPHFVHAAAIARDTIGGVRVTGASPTNYAFTMGTVSNGYLVAWVLNESGDNVTGVTFNSVAMSQLKKIAVGSFELYTYGLANPSSGNHNVTVTSSSGTNDVMAVSYSNVSPTEPDAVSSQNVAAGASPLIATVTTIANNAWTVLVCQSTGVALTAGTGSTFLQNDTGTEPRSDGIYDSNGAITPAGSHSMRVTWTGTGTVGCIITSLAPALPTFKPWQLWEF